MLSEADIAKSFHVLNSHCSQLVQEDLSFRVHYWGIDPAHYDNPVHQHSFYEVCYVLDGEGTYWEQGKPFDLRKGTLFLSRPWIRHQIRSESGMYLVYVAYEVMDAQSQPPHVRSYQALSETDIFVLPDAGDTDTAQIWRTLLDRSIRPGDVSKTFLKSLGTALLLSFHSTFGSDSEPLSRFESLSPSALALKRGILFVQDNLPQTFPLEETARYLHLSGRHLSRLFRQELGVSYNQFVNSEKIKRALYLLSNTELSILEIAEKAGFNSVHYFTRAFARHMGMSPGRYRNRKE